MVEGIPARANDGPSGCLYPLDKNVLDHYHHFPTSHGRGHSCPSVRRLRGLHLPFGQECPRPLPPLPDTPWSRAFLPECAAAPGTCIYLSDKNVLTHQHHFPTRHGRGHSCPSVRPLWEPAFTLRTGMSSTTTTTSRHAMVEGIPARAYAGFGACIYPSDKNVLDHHHFPARHGRGHSCPSVRRLRGLHLPLGQECPRPLPLPDTPWSRAFLPEQTTAPGNLPLPLGQECPRPPPLPDTPWSRAFLPERTPASDRKSVV